MNKKMSVWIIGGLITASVIGFGFVSTGSAAESKQQMPMQQGAHTGMMGNMDPKAMADMMNSPEMQKQCVEMMKNPEMQKSMMNMMKLPEMQGMMKQMLQQDMGFHQMMTDLVNSVDMNSDHSMPQTPMGAPQGGHGGHHG